MKTQHTYHEHTEDLPVTSTITLEIIDGEIVGLYPICSTDTAVETAIRRLASIIRPGVIIHQEGNHEPVCI